MQGDPPNMYPFASQSQYGFGFSSDTSYGHKPHTLQDVVLADGLFEGVFIICLPKFLSCLTFSAARPEFAEASAWKHAP